MSGETISANTGENQEKALDPRVESLAIPLARDYAEKNYKTREDGTYEPAWRGINGEKELKGKSPEDLMAEGYSELAAHEAVIDIANQPYDEYSEYWKEQNRGGAEFLIHLMDERGVDVLRGLDLQDEKTRSEYGNLIHENWVSRNEWVKDPNYGNPELACSFAELSPEEQQKDIDQLAILQWWLDVQEALEEETENHTVPKQLILSEGMEVLRDHGMNSQIAENRGVRKILEDIIPNQATGEYDEQGNLIFKTGGEYESGRKTDHIIITINTNDGNLNIINQKTGSSQDYGNPNPITDYSSMKIEASDNGEVSVLEQSKKRAEHRINTEWYPNKNIKESRTIITANGTIISRTGKSFSAPDYDADEKFNSSDENLLRTRGEDF